MSPVLWPDAKQVSVVLISRQVTDDMHGNCLTYSPVLTSQTRTVRSELPDIRCLVVLLNYRALIQSECPENFLKTENVGLTLQNAIC